MPNDAKPALTGTERYFDDTDVIVSKTDTKGWITYANETFLEIADYGEDEVVGKPHSLIRHPDMPRCVFKLLWDTVQAGQELFAYVINRTKFGDHYWVLAHVTPSFDKDGAVVGYHSNRRVPRRDVITGVITPLYRQLVDAEHRAHNPKDGLAASAAMLAGILKDKGTSYDKWVLTL